MLSRLEEDATDGVVIGESVIDVRDKPNQFFRCAATPHFIQAGCDFRHVLKFDSANDLGDPVLKMIETNSVGSLPRRGAKSIIYSASFAIGMVSGE